MEECTSTTIPKHVYNFYKPFIWFFRFIAIFPVTVYKSNTNYLLEFSKFYFFLGTILGTFVIFMVCWGMVIELTSSPEYAVKIIETTDRLVLFSNVIGYILIYFCGVFIVPSKFINFFKYMTSLNQVDVSIKTDYKLSEKYRLLMFLGFIIVLNTSLGCVDITTGYNIAGSKLGLLEVMRRYLGLCYVAYMSNLIEFSNKILLNALERKIKRLNLMLELEAKNDFTIYKTVKQNALERNLVLVPPRYKDMDTIARLTQIYQIIVDAGNALNGLVSLCILAVIVAVYWGLLQSAYFFALAFSEKTDDTKNTKAFPESIMVLFFQIFRVLLITEPAYACLLQAEATKRVVCHLLCCDVEQHCKKEIRRFAVVMELKKLEFSACGLFVVDRRLFISLLDSIITLLVIFLQYHHQ